MKTLGLFLVGIALSFTVVAEQGKINKLQEKLNLTEEQIEPVDNILSAQREKRRTIMEEHRQRIQEDMDALHKETTQLLSTELTSEQLEEYQELREQRIQKREARREKRLQKYQEKDAANS